MLMLALSTSGPVASTALIKDGEVVSFCENKNGLTHSETIMPLCEEALQQQGLFPADMDAFCVDIGPGSFTGVRIGVCAANAMAAAFSRPVIGISSLESLIFDKENACALIDSRNGNGYAMAKCSAANLEERAVVVKELLKALPDGITFFGDGGSIHKEAILQALPAARLSEKGNVVNAASVGLAAWQKLAEGKTETQVMPLYLRPSQAERLSKEKSK